MIESANFAVFKLRWERYTGRALPDIDTLKSEGVVDGMALPKAPPWPAGVPYEVKRPLLGYALDNASVNAGGHARFCISSELPTVGLFLFHAEIGSHSISIENKIFPDLLRLQQ